MLTASQIKTTTIKHTFMGVTLSDCGYNEHDLMSIVVNVSNLSLQQ